jgi:hypothetical protein
VSLKTILAVRAISIIREPSTFVHLGLLLISIRIVTFWIGNLAETSREWNGDRLAWPGRTVQRTWSSSSIRQMLFIMIVCTILTKMLDSEKLTHHASNMVYLDIDSIQMISAPQEPFRDSE